jgi:hypothetical protein
LRADATKEAEYVVAFLFEWAHGAQWQSDGGGGFNGFGPGIERSDVAVERQRRLQRVLRRQNRPARTLPPPAYDMPNTWSFPSRTDQPRGVNFARTRLARHFWQRTQSLAEPWADTGTSTGRLMLAVLGGLADGERDLIRTRTAEGHSPAKKRGQRMDRLSKLTEAQKFKARRGRSEGATLAELARSYHVGKSTILRFDRLNQTGD